MSSSEIDPQLLPKRVAFDTGVAIRALGERKDADAPICRKLFDAVLAAKSTVLLAAPVVAEMVRRDGAVVPHVRGVEVVAFDWVAADILGKRFPMSVLSEAQSTSGQTLTYLKFDSLIVACALRAKADVLVSLDTGLHTLAQKVQMRCARPEEFLKQQMALALGGPADETE